MWVPDDNQFAKHLRKADPAEQESTVAHLHYAEAVAAIHLLGAGGDFVLKMFTLFEHRSVALLYMLGCMFKELHVVKPSCSTQANAEVKSRSVTSLRYKYVAFLIVCVPSTFFRISQLLP